MAMHPSIFLDRDGTIIEELKAKGITISEVFFCPHKSEDNCECKRLKPYLSKPISNS